MGLGIISDDDYESELSKYDSSIIISIPDARQGDIPSSSNPSESSNSFPSRKPGRNNQKEVPESLRKLIATSAIKGEATGKVLAANFGISPSSVAAYKAGSTSCASYGAPNKELLEHGNEVRDKISKRASHRILLALNHITKDKIASAKLTEVASVAKDMASVMDKMQPRQNTNININNQNKQDVQYVFFAPREKKEEEYEVIDVSETA